MCKEVSEFPLRTHMTTTSTITPELLDRLLPTQARAYGGRLSTTRETHGTASEPQRYSWGRRRVATATAAMAEFEDGIDRGTGRSRFRSRNRVRQLQPQTTPGPNLEIFSI